MPSDFESKVSPCADEADELRPLPRQHKPARKSGERPPSHASEHRPLQRSPTKAVGSPFQSHRSGSRVRGSSLNLSESRSVDVSGETAPLSSSELQGETKLVSSEHPCSGTSVKQRVPFLLELFCGSAAQ